MVISEEIKEQFKEVIRYSQGIKEPKIDKLFDTFCTSKDRLYTLLGEQLIWESDVIDTFTFSEEEREIRFNQFLDRVDNYYGYYNLRCFLEVQKDGFFENKVIKDSEGIKAGTKLIKSFKYFIENPVELRTIQDEASVIIQEDKIEGRLCLSIHPLDFLSTSENTLNWRSCHALDGDYKAGNLSYMMDEVTFIAYVKTDKDTKLPNFPSSIKWNNKKSRVLMFMSNDKQMLFAGRPYPAMNMDMLNTIRTVLLDLMGQGNWYYSRWNNTYLNRYPVEPFPILDTPYVLLSNMRLIAMDILIKDMSQLHFNDLLYSSYYIPYYCQGSYSNDVSTRLCIGGSVPCLYCEEEELTEHHRMSCDTCEEKYGNEENDDFCFCDSCGRHLRVENAVWANDDSIPICQECSREIVKKCDKCKGKFLLSDLLFFWKEKTEKCVCKECYKEEPLNGEE